MPDVNKICPFISTCVAETSSIGDYLDAVQHNAQCTTECVAFIRGYSHKTTGFVVTCSDDDTESDNYDKFRCAMIPVEHWIDRCHLDDINKE